MKIKIERIQQLLVMDYFVVKLIATFDEDKKSLDYKRSVVFGEAMNFPKSKGIDVRIDCVDAKTDAYTITFKDGLEDVIEKIRDTFQEANSWVDKSVEEIDVAPYNEILNPTPF